MTNTIVQADPPPAVGTGNPACSGVDQRGVARPQSGACDKGSVEV
jgi:hypothetical protein